MAGDWIKMTCGLENDPAVIAIVDALDLDTDAILGKLYRLWTWADQHLEDGNAHGVTDSWVDRYLGVSGLAQSLVKVGWLTINGEGIVIPDFDKHMGQSAKRRALTSRRVTKHRCNAKTVTREEKRREEKKGNDTPPASRVRHEYPDHFETFWKAYPKKASKATALKAWKKIAPEDREMVTADIERHKRESPKWKNGYIHDPATWLNGACWKDDFSNPERVRPAGQPPEEREIFLRNMMKDPDAGKRTYAEQALAALEMEGCEP